MNKTAAYFKTIGERMADELGEARNPENVFAGIATRVLEAVPAPPIDLMAMADWTVQQDPFPEQVNFSSGFGQPPLVVYEAPGFYIEVLFWFPSRTSIHGHGFTGAFLVLDGYSIQVTYQFEEESAPEPGIRLGKLMPNRIELIRGGTICPILGQSDFIHTVVHMGNPSLTLVARTYSAGDLEQFSFLRCGFSYLSHEKKSATTRQADVLAALFKVHPSEFVPHLIGFLHRVDTLVFFKVLSRLINQLTLPVFSREVFPLLQKEFQHTQGKALEALDEIMRTLGLWGVMPTLKDPKSELLLALAELFPEEKDRDALISRSSDARDARDAKSVIEDWMAVAAAEKKPGK